MCMGVGPIALTLMCARVGTVHSLPPPDKHNIYNVLFIAVDDLRPELGCYGVTDAQSPNIDAFAKTSMVFNRHYAAVATCGASRYALLTGISPSISRVTSSNEALFKGLGSLKQTEQTGAQTMPELFRRSGYHTTCIGKISHTPDGRVYGYDGSGDGRPELPGAWDDLVTPFGVWKRGWGTFFAYPNGRHREDKKGNNDLMDFTTEEDTALPDGQMARVASDTLKKYANSKQRFFLGLGFYKPHLPFVAPKQDWDAFEGSRLLPTVHPEKSISPYWHDSGEFFRYKMPWAKSAPLSTESQLITRRAYLACVRYTDRQVGDVLRVLKATGLDKTTIVVLWGDHGWHLGDQQIYGKHSPFERSMRSTLIVHVPNSHQKVHSTDSLAESTDIYPTLLELCKPSFTTMAHAIKGQSLLPILNNPAHSVHKAAVSYWNNAISIRSKTHRLMAKRTATGGFTDIVLLNLTASLDANENIASQHPEIVEELLKAL